MFLYMWVLHLIVFTRLTQSYSITASCYQEYSSRGSKLHRVRLHLPGSDLCSVCFLQLASPIMSQLSWSKVNHDCWWCDLCVSGTFVQWYTSHTLNLFNFSPFKAYFPVTFFFKEFHKNSIKKFESSELFAVVNAPENFLCQSYHKF